MKRKLIDPDALRALAAEGKTIPEIAELLDFSKSGVRHCCELHGVKPKLAQHGRKAGFKVKPVAPVAKRPCVTPVNARLSDETAAHEARVLTEIKQSTHTEARPCVTHKPTPVEALQNRIKLPWTGKVQQQAPADLAPDLYDELVKYGADGIAEMFGFTADGFEVWLKKYGYPTKAPEPVPAVEHDLTIKPRAGQTFAGREKEMAAKRAASYEKLKTAVANNEIKIDAVPVFRGYDYADGEPITYVLGDPDGLNYQDRHFLGIDTPHQPTADELTEIFEPEPPAGILQTAERLVDLIKQSKHLREEERLVTGLRAKVDKDIAECLQVIQEAAR